VQKLQRITEEDRLDKEQGFDTRQKEIVSLE
jgi:hypothetical protein